MKQSYLSRQTIQNFFEGKTTRMQNILIQEWLEHPQNRELYFQWLEEWELENPQFTPDVEIAYRRSLNQPADNTIEISAPDEKRPEVIKTFPKLLKWVAVACLFLFAGAYMLQDLWRYKQYETSYGEIRVIRLADSSRVTLNANSVLTVPRFGFGTGTRRVTLQGEAEFAIKHTNDHRKFIVQTPDQLEVKVLGTEFIVYSRERGSKVVLSQGSVQLTALKDAVRKPVMMKPGDVAILSTQGKLSVSHSESLSTHTAWKQHRFMFENTPVSEIAYQISEQFGVNMIVADSTLARRTIGGTFNAVDADGFIKVLAHVLNARVTHKKQSDEKSETYILNSNE